MFAVWDTNLLSTIPTEIGLLTAMEVLEIDQNNHTGSIPTEIGKLTRLTGLFAHGNSFVSNLPSEIGKSHFVPGSLILATSHPLMIRLLFPLIGNLSKLESLELGRRFY